MDCKKAGELIQSLRKEKGMTQKQLAHLLHLSDKTVSKWETGKGSPDISLLENLSEILGVNIGPILNGELNPNNMDGGNMKRIKFYVCPVCGNVLTATGQAEISCCGRKLEALEAKEADETHRPEVQIIEQDYYVTFDHPMTKEHYLTFAAWVSYDRVLLMRLYPEQAAEVRFPGSRRGQLYFYCSRHGFMTAK